MPRPALTPQLRHRVMELRALTFPIDTIAAVLGVTAAEVERVLEEAAVKVQRLHPECTPSAPVEAVG